MLRFRDGKFFACGLSFVFPNGFYIDTELDAIAENAIVAWAPDMRYRVEWQIYRAEYNTIQDFEQLFKYSGFTILSELMPVALNGLTGHQIYYKSTEETYYELRLSNGKSSIMLYISVYQGDGNIYSIISSSEVQAIISGLRNFSSSK